MEVLRQTSDVSTRFADAKARGTLRNVATQFPVTAFTGRCPPTTCGSLCWTVVLVGKIKANFWKSFLKLTHFGCVLSDSAVVSERYTREFWKAIQKIWKVGQVIAIKFQRPQFS